MRERISVILPTYNEADNIVQLIKQIVDELIGQNYEIIVVDDDSEDGTSRIVEDCIKKYEKLRLITRTSNKGLVQAIKAGIHSSEGDICIWMDADLSMSPVLIKEIVYQLNNGADLVLGSRYIPGGGMKGSNNNKGTTPIHEIYKNLTNSEDSIWGAYLSKIGNKLFQGILDPYLHDYSSGFFGAKKEILAQFELAGGCVDYCISLSYRALMKGLKVVEVPMVLSPRIHGYSKTTHSGFEILKVASNCLLKAIQLRFTVSDERDYARK